jgi:hypothetical protein
MKVAAGSILLVLSLMLCVPATSFAAIRIKKTEHSLAASRVAATRTYDAGTEYATIDAVHQKQPHNSGFRKIIKFLKPDAKHLKKLAVIFGAVSLYCGGLGLPRFIYGYTEEGLLQAAAFAGFWIGLILIAASFSTTGVIFGFFMPGLIFIGIHFANVIWQIVDFINICTGRLKPKNMGSAENPE